MKKDNLAINIKQECADIYYENFDNLPNDLKKQISFHLLAEVFRVMVVPAIDHARFVDRNGYSDRASSKTIESIMEKITNT